MLHDPRVFKACTLAMGVSAVAIVSLLPVGKWLGLVDHPDHFRKQHAFDTPLVGGLAISMGILVGWWCLGAFNKFEDALIGTTFGLVLVGVIDDFMTIRVGVRVIAQLVAITVVILISGVYIHSLGTLHGHELTLGWLGIPFTMFAVIGLLNAFNLIDGIDGLAGCLALVAAGAIGLCSNVNGLTIAIASVAVMVTAVLPYLAFNLGLFGRNGKVFLGDAGSVMLGYLLAWTLIEMSQSTPREISPGLVLWCVALPVFDTLTVMFRRMYRGESPFTADRGHIHHLLMDAGLNPRTTLVCLVVFAATLPFFGRLVHRLKGPVANLVAFAALLALYGMLTTYLCRRREQKQRQQSPPQRSPPLASKMEIMAPTGYSTAQRSRRQIFVMLHARDEAALLPSNDLQLSTSSASIAGDAELAARQPGHRDSSFAEGTRCADWTTSEIEPPSHIERSAQRPQD